MRVIGVGGNVHTGDDARDCRAAGYVHPIPLGRARQELLDDFLVSETGMLGVNTRVQNANQGALARSDIRAIFQLEIGICLVGPDSAKGPLDVETRGTRHGFGNVFGQLPVLFLGNAALIVGLDASILHLTQLLLVRPGKAAGQGHREHEKQGEDSLRRDHQLVEPEPCRIPRTGAVKTLVVAAEKGRDWSHSVLLPDFAAEPLSGHSRVTGSIPCRTGRNPTYLI